MTEVFRLLVLMYRMRKAARNILEQAVPRQEFKKNVGEAGYIKGMNLRPVGSMRHTAHLHVAPLTYQ
jgi:hypothetical protein